MKKIAYWLICGLTGAGMFLLGFFIRQPKINKLKKQVALLQADNAKLLRIARSQHDEYCELLIKHKALKAYNFEKRAISKDKLSANLVLQYALKAYIELLMKCVKFEKELNKPEIIFFNAYEKVIDGKNLSNKDMLKIREYILEQYPTEIKNLKEFDYNMTIQEFLNDAL